jgi:hypothetical protein
MRLITHKEETMSKKKEILAENGKMTKSVVGHDGLPVYVRNFDISRISCLWADLCGGSNCYVFRLENAYPDYRAKLDRNYEFTKSPEFVPIMIEKIRYTKRTMKGRTKWQRIHAAGEFYDATYLLKWVAIMKALPDVNFYAYTKAVSLVKFVRDRWGLPSNFTVIFSYGGKEDHLIDPAVDRHSFVFKDKASFDAGYADASDNDMVAVDPANHRIGLKYHAQKKFEKTGWARVKRNASSVA